MSSRLKSHAHSVFSLHVHVVFVTKSRKKVITAEMLARLREIFNRLCLSQKCQLLEFGGEADHVQLLIAFSPDTTISKLVNNLKAVSSRLIRKEFASRVNHFYSKPAFWTNAYCAITAGGAPLETLKHYIHN
ncbi:MAG: IS200/IS605 family transposase [Xenococcaceae cyanobacterium]